MNDDVGKPPPLHTCPVCGVSVGSGPVVSASHRTGLSETRPPIEWRCVHETGGQAMKLPISVKLRDMADGWARCPTGPTGWLTSPELMREAADEIDRLEKQYYELLYAVSKKHEGETRHDTALRYIRERESAPCEAAKEAAP